MKHTKHTFNMGPIIKIILAVLLLLTLTDMPGSFNYWAKVASALAFLYTFPRENAGRKRPRFL